MIAVSRGSGSCLAVKSVGHAAARNRKPHQKGQPIMRLAYRDTYRSVVFLAVIVAIAMIVLCVTDLFAEYPYQPFMEQMTFSITSLISSAILLYMCWHTWHDLQLGDVPTTRKADVRHASWSSSSEGPFRLRGTKLSGRTDRHSAQDRATVS